MTEYEVDPIVWFGEREIPFTPRHFVIANHPLTFESKKWILSNLRGRFSIVSINSVSEDNNIGIPVVNIMGKPAFEDPKEALLYELTWS